MKRIFLRLAFMMQRIQPSILLKTIEWRSVSLTLDLQTLRIVVHLSGMVQCDTTREILNLGQCQRGWARGDELA